jgi:hypothetical protein
MGELPLAYALEFCLLLVDLEPARWQRAIRAGTRGRARSVKMTVEESVLALSAAKALAGPQRPTAAYTLQRLANAHGLERGCGGST